MSEPAPVSGDPTVADEVGELLSEFTSRLQRGEQLSVEEFVAQHPRFADELRRLLPTALALTGLVPWADAGTPTGRPGLSTLGDFQLLREIGRGGMGVVYEAVQISLGRRVALKVLPFAGVLDPRQLQRFNNEARAAATLDHPHIVHVHAVGQERGVHYYAMQLIDGQSLAEFLNANQESPTSERGGVSPTSSSPASIVKPPCENHGGLTPRRAPDSTARLVKFSTLPGLDDRAYFRQVARWGIEAAEALDYAHQMGIVHRDIKPSNLMINADGKLWVTDFGLAMTQSDTGLSMTGDLLGTLRYMSPEQVQGARRALDHRTDIYSLGATLFELLARQPLIVGQDRADMLRKIVEAEPPPLRTIRRETPVDLETIVLKSLRKEPGERYASAQAMADDLQRFLDDRPIVAQPLRWREALMKWGRRHTFALGAALLAALFAVLVLSVSIVLVSRARQTALVAERQRRMELASFEFERSLAKCSPDDAATGLLWLTKSLERVHELGATNLESGIRRQIDGWSRHVPELQMMWSHPAAVTKATFLLDGKTALTVCQDLRVRLWDVETGALRCPPIEHPQELLIAEVSPNGTMIVTAGADHAAQRWDAVTGHRLGPPLKHEAAVKVMAFSPDGRILATGSQDHAVQLWNAETGDLLVPPVRTEGAVTCLAFNPDGTQVISGNSAGQAALWDTATGASLGVAIAHKFPVTVAAFSPDSRTVATAVRDTAFLWNAETGELLATLSGHDRELRILRFSRDGKIVLTATPDRTARLWDAATGRAIGRPLVHNAAVTSAEFTADGERLLTASLDWRARLWDVATCQQVGSAINCQAGISQATLSPDGRTILTGDHAGFGRIWDVANMAPRRSDPLPDRPVYVFAVNPQQTLVFTGRDSTASLWDAQTLRRHGHPLLFNGATRKAVFSPDGSTLLITSDGFDMVRLWDVQTTEPRGPALQLPTPIFDAAFSPDGRSFVTAAREPFVRIWDVATQQPLAKLEHPAAVLSLAYHPDGKTLLTGCADHCARRWDLASQVVIEPIMRHNEQVAAVAYSTDGKTMITGGYDHTARLWDAQTGLPIGAPYDHGDVSVSFVRLAPDGKTLVTATGANQVIFWNLETDKPIGPPNPFFHRAESVCLSPDGSQLLANDGRDAIRIWTIPQTRTDSIEQISLWATALTGLELDASGSVRPLDAETWKSRQKTLTSQAGTQALHSPPAFRRDR